MKRYIYFVSYSHTTGHGCVDIFMNKKIDSFDDIEQLCKITIPKKNGLKNIVVLNYQLLREENV